MNPKYKKMVGFSAFGLAMIGSVIQTIRGGLVGLEKDRRKRKEAERRESERKERNNVRKREWEERQQRRAEGCEILEIDGILHFKNKFGCWEPMENKTNSDIKITVGKNNENKKGEEV